MKLDSTVKELINNLLMLYPDKNIQGLKEKSDIYKTIKKLAQHEDMSERDYLMMLGFKYNGVGVCERLLAIYPDKQIENLKNKDKELYRVCIANAFRERLLPKEYFERMGFGYVNDSSQDSTEQSYSGKGRRPKVVKLLAQLYPNKTIPNFIITEPMFRDIYANAKAKNQTMKEYLASLGFRYLGVSPEEILIGMYPDRVAYFLENRDYALYFFLKEVSKKLNIRIEKLFSRLGFRFVNNFGDVPVDKLLEIEYPDKTVVGLETNTALYRYMKKVVASRNTTIQELVESLGFKFVNKDELKEKTIVSKLSEYYPDKKVSMLATRDTALYHQVSVFARRRNINITEYLASLGFTYSPSKPTGRRMFIDSEKTAMLEEYLKSRGINFERASSNQ